MSLADGKNEFTEDKLTKYIERSAKLTSVDVSEIENIKKDIIYITCLLQRDGYDNYVFLHKSVQEFHAAKFVSKISNTHKKKIYEKISTILTDNTSLDVMISFLKEIDRDDFESLLQIPIIDRLNLTRKRNITSTINKSINNITAQSNIIDIGEELTSWSIFFGAGNTLSLVGLLKNNDRHLMLDPEISDLLYLTLEDEAMESYNNNQIDVEKYKVSFDTYDSFYFYNVPMIKIFPDDDDLIDSLKNALTNYLVDYMEKIHKPLKKKKESLSKLIDFELS